ncbi:MAG: hypothetical protein ACKVP7_25945 [Hyphomicrobiaceae bacterium]
MPLNADTRAPVTGAPGSVAAAGGLSAAARPNARTRTVLVYIALALLALAPGIMLRLGYSFGGSLADAPLQALHNALDDIRFGSGLRFWLGVSGASMMLLLILYPLRKALAQRFRVGSVGAWFHVHMILGLAGPVLILYHTNFGLGGKNANVALWTMLIVVGSGVIGHFVYANVSAEFYAGKQKAREQLDAIAATLTRLDSQHATRRRLIEDLEAFDADLLTPRQGVVASIRARWQVERYRRQFSQAMAQYLAQCASELRLARADHERLRAVVGAHLVAYIRFARHASSRSVREQIWARWRLFHLPVFLVMIAAAVLHIYAVWDMPPPEQKAAVTPVAPIKPATSERKTAPARAAAPDVRKVTTTEVAPTPPTATPQKPVPVKRVAEAPKPAPEPQATTRIEPPKAVVQVPPAKALPPAPATPSPPPAIVAAAPPSTPPPPTAEERTAIKELQRRIDEPPMSLGGAKPRTLAEQIEVLKEKQRRREFAHSEAETGFALTGKHLKVDCAACHKVPLKETRKPQSQVRVCLDCHKQDDIHRGKRPDCAQCHTTNRWSQIIKRK